MASTPNPSLSEGNWTFVTSHGSRPVDTWAIGFGLNARGATGIILAGVGRAAGVIDDRIFVAIVVMALVTSLIAGPMMNWLLSKRITAIDDTFEYELESGAA